MGNHPLCQLWLENPVDKTQKHTGYILWTCFRLVIEIMRRYSTKSDITIKLSKTVEVDRRSLCASNIMESPMDFPDSAIGSYLEKVILYKDDFLSCHVSLPFRNFRTITAIPFILVSQSGELLLETVIFEHLICSLLVECTAHALICWLHWKDGCATDSLSLPDAVLHHA